MDGDAPLLVLGRRPERQALLGRVSGGRRGGCPLGQRLAGAIFLLPRQAPACGHHLFVFETLDFFFPPFFPFLSFFRYFFPSLSGRTPSPRSPLRRSRAHLPAARSQVDARLVRVLQLLPGGAGGASPCFPQACNQWKESFYRALHEARRAPSLGVIQ